MPDLTIVEYGPEHADAVPAIVDAAFGDALMARAAALTFARGEARVALVARADEQFVGFLQASAVTIPGAPGRYLGIVPLAVLPAFQRRGVGSGLVRRAVRDAGGLGMDALFVLGDPGFYQRFGFTRSHIGNTVGAGRGFMHLELATGVLEGVSGTARYADAFREAGVEAAEYVAKRHRQV